MDAWVSPDGAETARHARLRRRALAGLIDWSLCAVLFLIVSVPAGMVLHVGTWAIVEGSGTLGVVLIVVSQAIVGAAVVAYFALGLRSGQTLGMRAVEVHARLAETGLLPGTARAAGRGALGFVFALAFVTAQLGLTGRTSVEDSSAAADVLLAVAYLVAGVALVGKAWALVDPARRTLWDRRFGLVFLEDLDARKEAEMDYGTWLRRRAGAPS